MDQLLEVHNDRRLDLLLQTSELTPLEREELNDLQQAFHTALDSQLLTELNMKGLGDAEELIKKNAATGPVSVSGTAGPFGDITPVIESAAKDAVEFAEKAARKVAAGTSLRKCETLQEAETAAAQLVNEYSAFAAIASPLPMSSIYIMSLQAEMVKQIAQIYNVTTWDQVNMGTAAGLGVAGRYAAAAIAEACTFIPGYGLVVKAAIAGTLTKAAGEAMRKVFVRLSPLALTENETASTSDPLAS